MAWDIEFTDEFGGWWETLTDGAQIDVDTVVGLLQENGPNLPLFIRRKRIQAFSISGS